MTTKQQKTYRPQLQLYVKALVTASIASLIAALIAAQITALITALINSNVVKRRANHGKYCIPKACQLSWIGTEHSHNAKSIF